MYLNTKLCFLDKLENLKIDDQTQNLKIAELNIDY